MLVQLTQIECVKISIRLLVGERVNLKAAKSSIQVTKKLAYASQHCVNRC